MGDWWNRRHARLKIECREASGFKSLIPYHQPVAKCSNAVVRKTTNRRLKSDPAVQGFARMAEWQTRQLEGLLLNLGVGVQVSFRAPRLYESGENGGARIRANA